MSVHLEGGNHAFVAKQKVAAVRRLANRNKSGQRPADPKVSHAQLPLSSLLRAGASRKSAGMLLPSYSRVAKPDRLVGDRVTIGSAILKRQADASEWSVGRCPNLLV